MTTFEAYLFTRLDIIHLILMLIVSSIGLITAYTFVLEKGIMRNPPDIDIKGLKTCKGFFIVFAVSLILALCVPTKEEAAFIYIAPKVINENAIDDGLIKDEGLKYMTDALDGR